VLREQQGTPGNLEAVTGISTVTMNLKWVPTKCSAAQKSSPESVADEFPSVPAPEAAIPVPCVEDFPGVLVPIILKRFRFRNEAAQRSSRPVKIPQLINFKPFALTPSQGPTMLRLHAVICHLGEQVSSGHYVAFVRNGPDASGGWLFFDDMKPGHEQVRLVESLDDVAGVNPMQDGYILVYEAVEKDALTDYEVALRLQDTERQEHVEQEVNATF